MGPNFDLGCRTRQCPRLGGLKRSLSCRARAEALARSNWTRISPRSSSQARATSHKPRLSSGRYANAAFAVGFRRGASLQRCAEARAARSRCGFRRQLVPPHEPIGSRRSTFLWLPPLSSPPMSAETLASSSNGRGRFQASAEAVVARFVQSLRVSRGSRHSRRWQCRSGCSPKAMSRSSVKEIASRCLPQALAAAFVPTSARRSAPRCRIPPWLLSRTDWTHDNASLLSTAYRSGCPDRRAV